MLGSHKDAFLPRLIAVRTLETRISAGGYPRKISKPAKRQRQLSTPRSMARTLAR